MDWEEENPVPLAIPFFLVGGNRIWKKREDDAPPQTLQSFSQKVQT